MTDHGNEDAKTKQDIGLLPPSSSGVRGMGATMDISDCKWPEAAFLSNKIVKLPSESLTNQMREQAASGLERLAAIINYFEKSADPRLGLSARSIPNARLIHQGVSLFLQKAIDDKEPTSWERDIPAFLCAILRMTERALRSAMRDDARIEADLLFDQVLGAVSSDSDDGNLDEMPALDEVD